MSEISNVAAQLAEGFGKATGQSVQALVAPKIDTLVAQAKLDIAKRTKRQPQAVTDLEVARYFSNMPTADLSGALAEKVDLLGKSVRNAVLISGLVIALAIVLSKALSKGK